MRCALVTGVQTCALPICAAIRSRLCAAAEELFVEEGEAALSMRRLTAKVGCSAMAPYRYFADKEALIASIRAQAFRRPRSLSVMVEIGRASCRKECVSTCRSRGSPYHEKKNSYIN